MTSTSAANDARLVNAEHEVQMRLLSELRKALRDGRDGRELHTQLTDYCRAHFLSEELLMRLHAYPGYDDHVADHEQMLDALDGLNDPTAIDALSGFLLRHIGDRDAKLHFYLEKV